MNGTGKVSFARKTRRHATEPAPRTGAGGAGNMRVGGPWCVLVGWCLGAWVSRWAEKVDGEGRRPFLLASLVASGREGRRRRPAAVPDPLAACHVGAWVCR